MKVLVTGGTGFVGRELLRELQAADRSIRVLVRNPSGAREQGLAFRFGAELCPGDVLKPESLVQACDGVEAVVHLVGIISEAGSATFENLHTRATANVLLAAQRAGIKRFVHMSALGTRPNAVSRYHRTKWEAEESVRRSGLECTIFRPSLIYGAEDQFLNLFLEIARYSPIVPMLGNRHARFQPVPVQIVAQAFVRALPEPQTIGQTYDLCGPEKLTLAEIVDRLLSVAGRKRLKVHIPALVARSQARLLEALYPILLGKAPPLNRDQLLMLEEDNCGDPEPANHLLGLRAPPFREGIETFLT